MQKESDIRFFIKMYIQTASADLVKNLLQKLKLCSMEILNEE